MSVTISALAQTQFVEVAGTRVAYREFGRITGTPLVLFHRFRGTMDHWDPALLDVLARERPVIIFDNLGVGASEGECGASIAAMAQAAGDFVDAVGLSQIDLLGWSMGGAVCQQLYLDRPGLVRRMVLAGTGPGGVAEAPKAPEKVCRSPGNPSMTTKIFCICFSLRMRKAVQRALRRCAVSTPGLLSRNRR